MYTVCYVVTDETGLKYYNEMMISLASLRKQAFSGQVRIVTDAETRALFTEANIRELAAFDAAVTVVDIPDGYTQKEKSRFIKTSLRKYMQGDYLFLDTDTVVADTLPDHITDGDLAMVCDYHCSFAEMTDDTRGELEDRSIKCGKPFFAHRTCCKQWGANQQNL